MSQQLQVNQLSFIGSGEPDGSAGSHPAAVTWAPTDDNGLVDWWTLDAGLGGSAASHTSWTSQGGQLSVFTSGGTGPDSNTQTLNGAAVLHFSSGSLEYYEIEDYRIFDGFSKGVITMVARPNTPDQTNESMLDFEESSGTANDFRFRAGDSDQFFGDVQQGISDVSDLSDTDISATWAVIAIEFNQNGELAQLFYDGTEVASEEYTVNLGTDGLLRIARTTDNSHILTMQLFGMTISTSPGHRELHEGYWAWTAQGDTSDKDFVAALPSDHPYKSAAPTT